MIQHKLLSKSLPPTIITQRAKESQINLCWAIAGRCREAPAGLTAGVSPKCPSPLLHHFFVYVAIQPERHRRKLIPVHKVSNFNSATERLL